MDDAKKMEKLWEAHEMGVEEFISAAGTLHNPYAHRCPACGRLISVLKEDTNGAS